MKPVQFDNYLKLLDKPLRRFLNEHEGDDEAKIVLGARDYRGVPSALVAQQIVGKRKAREKLPSFCHNDQILFPRSLSLEQSSSEKTAALKAEILSSVVEHRSTVVDLTGGFGVDSFFFSRVFDKVEYVELDEELVFLASHNHRQLGAKNISHHQASAETFLRSSEKPVDAIFIDPSRRSDNRKVFRFEDCSPDVLAIQETIFRRTPILLIKASPMLDIARAIQELQTVSRVIVVSVESECRELLFLCRAGWEREPMIATIHLTTRGSETFDFLISEEKSIDNEACAPQNYLFEPNPSILKAGAFKLAGSRFGLRKLHPNTHLYTGNSIIPDFPGRTFQIIGKLKSDPGAVGRQLPERKANVLVRNYPLSAELLRKKLKLLDGGNSYVIGTTSAEGRTLLHASRIYPSDIF